MTSQILAKHFIKSGTVVPNGSAEEVSGGSIPFLSRTAYAFHTWQVCVDGNEGPSPAPPTLLSQPS